MSDNDRAARGVASEGLPEHVTLPLLSLITAQSLDGDYQHVAERRKDSAQQGTKARFGRGVAIVVALFGLMVVVAAVQTSRDAATTEEGRQELIRQITLQRDDLRASQNSISDLRQENVDLADNVDSLQQVESRVNADLLSTRGYAGYAPVRGPGVRINVNDSPDGNPDGRVRDEDLSLLVDGLWVAGAEAISINGHRLTTISSIRSVDKAIHIKAQPIKPPYEVLAIGNPENLQSLFGESRPGLEWLALRRNYGFVFTMENATTPMDLPASRRALLRSAHVLQKDPLTMKEPNQ